MLGDAHRADERWAARNGRAAGGIPQVALPGGQRLPGDPGRREVRANRMWPSEILASSVEHLWLVAISVAVALAIAAPPAVILTRHGRLRRWTLGVVNVVQTVPSLALFGFLLPLPFIGGVGKPMAIVALILYALLPILAQHAGGHPGRGFRRAGIGGGHGDDGPARFCGAWSCRWRFRPFWPAFASPP